MKPTSTMKKVLVFILVFTLGNASSYFFATVTQPPPKAAPQQPQPAQTIQPIQPIQPTQPIQPIQPIQPTNDFFRFPSKCAEPLKKNLILPTVFRLFNKKSPYANFPPPHIREFLRHNEVHGWGSTNPVFELVISEARPKVIIEVGTFLGNSALHMANLTRTLGLTDTIILCLDDFRGWPGFGDYNNGMFKHIVDVNADVILMHQFMQNVVDAGEEGRIIPMPFSTGAALDALCLWGIYGDVVEVDAGHSFHSAWEDINRAWKVLKPGGILFGHDYMNGSEEFGVKRAVDLFAMVKGLRVVPNGEHWILYP